MDDDLRITTTPPAHLGTNSHPIVGTCGKLDADFTSALRGETA